jgi:N-acyl-D-aspartate/D-glutamate deacylase
MLIRGGTVIDGLGTPGRQEDVRLRDGAIVEVGPRLASDGETELDALGAIVVPGFVDAHTHLDPWLWRDPSFDPLPQHGVTTVVTGNCSLSLAPIGEDHAALNDMFAFIEDVPPDILAQAIPWDWRSWSQYVERASAVPATVRIAPLAGLSPIRLAVMGEAAFDRAATDEERGAIVEVVRGCLAAGAQGLSLSFIDTDSSGRPVPSRLADDAELTAVLQAVASSRSAIAQFNGGFDQVERMGRLCKATGAAATWVQLITYGDRPHHHRELLAQAARLRAEGANIRPQVSPRPLVFQLNLSGGTMQFMGLELWNDFANAPNDRKRALLADEAWRESARNEWDNAPGTMFPRHNLANVTILPTEHDRDPAALPRTLGELHARRGGHPADLFLDWVREHDLAPGLVVTVANDDVEQVAEVLCDPNTLVAASDVGAHMQMMAAPGDPTLMITRHVIERGDLTLEAAVRRLTSEPAEFLGMNDRGVLAAGRRADVAVIDLDELSYLPQQLSTTLLDGAAHFTRPAKGIRATIVDGVATQIDGVLTGARPAGMQEAGPAAGR